MSSTSSPSTFAHVPAAPNARLRLIAVVKAVSRPVGALLRALRHRHEVNRLLELDERGLKDIGLVRSDVVGALDVPFGTDPSVRLRLEAVSRRARARSLAFSRRAVSRCET